MKTFGERLITSTGMEVSEVEFSVEDMKEALENRWRKNRAISWMTVISYAEAMKDEKFPLLNGGVARDLNGKWCDGETRFRAAVHSNKPFRTLFFDKLTEQQVELIDSGRGRTIAQRIKITNPDFYVEMNKVLKVTRLVCDLIAGVHIKYNQSHDFMEWYKLVEKPSAWIIQATKTLDKTSFLRFRAFRGAMAFADRTNSEAIHQMVTDMVDTANKVKGSGFEPGDPAKALFETLSAYYANPLSRNASGSSVATVIRRTLNAAMLRIQGARVTDIVDSDEGERFFKKVYDADEAVQKLVRPWLKYSHNTATAGYNGGSTPPPAGPKGGKKSKKVSRKPSDDSPKAPPHKARRARTVVREEHVHAGV